MIQKVQRIKDFGVFSDFTWPTALHEFKQFNLLFGWNYSGKTTFSRTLRCFELLTRHVDFATAEVHLHCKGGAVHLLSTSTGPHLYRVFNVDFVRENIRFDEGHAEPILILGASDIAKQDLLKQKQEALLVVLDEIKEADASRKTINDTLDRALTAAARNQIKNPLRRVSYDKNKFAPKVDECKDSAAKNLLADTELQQTLDTYNSENKSLLPKLAIQPLRSLTALNDLVADVSSRTVTSVAIQAVAEDPQLERWVNEGRSLHEGNPDCRFCGGLLPPNFLAKLASHFSADYDNLMQELGSLRAALEQAKAVQVQIPVSESFYPDIAVRFEEAKTRWDQLLLERQRSLDVLLQTIVDKETKAYSALTCTPVTDNNGDLNSSLEEIQALISAHNERSQEFEGYREVAFGKLELHYASQFVLDQDYRAQKQLSEELGSTSEQATVVGANLSSDISLLERELSDAVQGAETINDLMRAYFGKDDLRITVNAQNRFQITRSGNIAKNLSEGERSAYAFVHFMTSLLDQRHPLSDTTVIVDDPMGSLDANHLFNTFSFVKTKLSGCYQLFVLTHNYEFYSLIKEWALDEEKQWKEKLQKDWKKWSIYLIRRTDDGSSTIDPIPMELLRFKSEYHYLFSTLLKFHETSAADYDYLFSLPNVARRFMEAFGGIMIPTYAGLRSKLPRFIPDPVQCERVWRFITDYSHNNSLNRSLVIPDISECKVVVSTCLGAVQRWNEDYYKDLVEAVK